MKICGLNKTTLLDYPGKLAAVCFLGGCNYRCPFCHNSALVLSPDREPEISMDDFTAFLQKRRSLLEGICVTGGEPTLHPELPAFLETIRSFGYQIKLDTNGTRPKMLRTLHQHGLVDMIAMDIKSSREHYGKVCGLRHPDLAAVEASVEYLITSGIDYEFRTTVVRELHTAEDFSAIGSWLLGARAYYLQSYQDSPSVISPGFSSYSREELETFRNILASSIELVQIRGID